MNDKPVGTPGSVAIAAPAKVVLNVNWLKPLVATT